MAKLVKWKADVRSDLLKVRTGQLKGDKKKELIRSLANQSRRKLSLLDALVAFHDYGCADPRDRVFGLRNVIDWQQGSQPIEPDYNLTRVQLAAQVLEHLAMDHGQYLNPCLSPQQVSVVMAALSLSKREPSISDFLSYRTHGYYPAEPQVPLKKPSAVQFGSARRTGSHAHQLIERGDHQLSIPDTRWTLPFGWVPDSHRFENYLQLKTIYIESAAIGCGCPLSRDGDLLAIFPEKRWVILRAAGREKYQIIGRALIDDGIAQFFDKGLGASGDSEPFDDQIFNVAHFFATFDYEKSAGDLVASASQYIPEVYPGDTISSIGLVNRSSQSISALASLYLGITIDEDEFSSYAILVQLSKREKQRKERELDKEKERLERQLEREKERLKRARRKRKRRQDEWERWQREWEREVEKAEGVEETVGKREGHRDGEGDVDGEGA